MFGEPESMYVSPHSGNCPSREPFPCFNLNSYLSPPSQVLLNELTKKLDPSQGPILPSDSTCANLQKYMLPRVRESPPVKEYRPEEVVKLLSVLVSRVFTLSLNVSSVANWNTISYPEDNVPFQLMVGVVFPVKL